MFAHDAFLRAAPNANDKLITGLGLGVGSAGEMQGRGKAGTQKQATSLSPRYFHRLILSRIGVSVKIENCNHRPAR
jgi:hypothetical protein